MFLGSRYGLEEFGKVFLVYIVLFLAFEIVIFWIVMVNEWLNGLIEVFFMLIFI